MGWVSVVEQIRPGVFVDEEWQKRRMSRGQSSHHHSPLLIFSPCGSLHLNGNETTMKDNVLRRAEKYADWNLRSNCLVAIWAFDKSTLNEQLPETRISMAKTKHRWVVGHSSIGWSNQGTPIQNVGQTNSEGDMELSDKRSDCELMSSSMGSG